MRHLHPRLTLHQASFPLGDTVAEDLAACRRLEVPRIGAVVFKLDEDWNGGLELLRDADVEVTHLVQSVLAPIDAPESWPSWQERACRSIDAAAALGAPFVYTTGGPAGTLDWDEAVAGLAAVAHPVVEYAATKGILLSIETTNPLFVDRSFVHTFRDTLDAARAAGLRVCFDIHPTWWEPRLRQLLAEAAPLIDIVQVSDYLPGTRTLFRAVPGDGIIPLERIVSWLLEDGFAGPFDLELFGDQGVPKDEAITRSLLYVDHLLRRLGA